jgi:hypothetical protein
MKARSAAMPRVALVHLQLSGEQLVVQEDACGASESGSVCSLISPPHDGHRFARGKCGRGDLHPQPIALGPTT